MSFSAPNYTQTPNELFALQADMKEAELRVTLAGVAALLSMVIVPAPYGRIDLAGFAAVNVVVSADEPEV